MSVIFPNSFLRYVYSNNVQLKKMSNFLTLSKYDDLFE